MKIELGKNRIFGLKIISAGEVFSAWWVRYYNFLFIILMFVSMGMGIYFWYASLYIPIMTGEDITSYKRLKDKGIVLNEETFARAVDSIEARSENYKGVPQEMRDIFK